MSRIECKLLLIAIAVVSLVFSTSCGSPSAGGQKFGGSTAVTVLMSSTANDALSRFALDVSSITLVSEGGTPVNIYQQEPSSGPVAPHLETIHTNGSAEPLGTISIPQGVYTSATATIDYASFTCVTLDSSGGMAVATYAYRGMPASFVTVSLPSPITITGESMGLLIDMQVSQSATYSSCLYSPGTTYSITLTFVVTPVGLATPPTNYRNGRATGLLTEVVSINATTFGVVALDTHKSLLIKTGSNTLYQRIGGLSELLAGMFVELDGDLQMDGSLLATRMSVLDPNTTNLSVAIGPVLQTNASQPMLITFGQRQEGYLSDSAQASIWLPYDMSGSLFQISGDFTNLQDLPFVPAFNSTNIVAGQNVYKIIPLTNPVAVVYSP